MFRLKHVLIRIIFDLFDTSFMLQQLLSLELGYKKMFIAYHVSFKPGCKRCKNQDLETESEIKLTLKFNLVGLVLYISKR